MIAATCEVAARLRKRIPIFAELQSISSQSAISIGVLHHGEKLFTHNLGRKDVAQAAPPDENTVYCIASLTKQLFSAAVSTLVAEGKLDWDARISSILPDFANQADPVIGHRATLGAILSHRSGLASLDAVVQGLDGELTLEQNEILQFANALPVREDFRTKWQYCNFGYSIAARIIDHISEETWAQQLENKIFKPLEMSRTTCKRDVHWQDDNVAKTYVALRDGTSAEVPPTGMDGGQANGAAGGVRSTASDLLRWSHALMTVNKLGLTKCRELLTSHTKLGVNSPCVVDADHKQNSPIHGYLSVSVPNLSSSADILDAAAIIDPKSTDGSTYGLGIVRQSTPAILGALSPNRNFSSPVLGRGSRSRIVLSHHGNFNGATASLYMLPDTVSAVVVLSNARGLSDATDWIAQGIIQTIFDLEPEIDILAEARDCRSKFDGWFNGAIKAPLETGRRPGLEGRRRSDFPGRLQLDGYKDFTLHIIPYSQDGERLVMVVNERPSQSHILSHYHYDVWEFAPASYDDYARKGYGPYESWLEFLISFQRRSDGKIWALKWHVEGSDVLFTKL